MTFIAHPIDEAQQKAIKAFFEALQIPYEEKPEVEETEHLLSTEANAKRLMDAIANEGEVKGVKVSLDDIWK